VMNACTGWGYSVYERITGKPSVFAGNPAILYKEKEDGNAQGAKSSSNQDEKQEASQENCQLKWTCILVFPISVLHRIL
jgi:hypothetical protein